MTRAQEALVDVLTRSGAVPFAVLDGGLSTALEELGERPAGALWTARTLLERPHVVTAAHRAAVNAGADVVITSSYQASEDGFVAAGVDRTSARRVLHSTTAVARASGARLVASSVGPFGACRADGSEYHGRYDTTWDEVREFHRRRLEVLVDSGPDLFAIETVPTITEARLIVDELRRLTDAPAWVSFSCAGPHHTCGGDRLGEALVALGDDVELIGVNCTAPGLVESLLESLCEGSRVSTRSATTDTHRDDTVGRRWVVYANHGADWDADAKCWRGVPSDGEPARHASSWSALGAVLVGGCCGVGTAAIAELAARRDALAGSSS